MGDRNPLAFISTQAGVSPNAIETDINGQRSSFSNVTLDGINIQDNYIRTGGLDYTPNEPLLSQVQEFTVITSNQGAASSGGASQVNFTTPSGGNEYHGYVFWQNRNNDFAANDFFDNQDGNPLPRLNLNQAARNIGGPIKKDKLFFYATYELYRLIAASGGEPAHSDLHRAPGHLYVPRHSERQIQQADVLATEGLPHGPGDEQRCWRGCRGREFINNYRVGDSQPGLLANTAGYGFLVRDNQDRDNATGKMDYYINAEELDDGDVRLESRQSGSAATSAVGYSPTPPFQNNDARNFLAVAWRTNPSPN